MDIKKFIGEATEYDKKVALEEKKPKSWLKSVSAFANEIGGVLLFGVSNDDELVGLADVKRDSEIISEQIKQRLDPVPQTILELHREDGKDFIVLRLLPVKRPLIIMSQTEPGSHSSGLGMRASLRTQTG